MKRFLTISILFVVLLGLFYLAGPKPDPVVLEGNWPLVPSNINELESFIAEKESAYHLRADNQAQIIWSDSVAKTEYVILYLHGFSASQGEGAPVHERIAKKFGANLLLARLSGHGYLTNQLSDFTAVGAWEAAKESLALAKRIGQKVIIMGTSTGCSYSLNLAAHFGDSIEALINLSPNVRVKDPAAFLLNNPWGEEIAKRVLGEKRSVFSDSIEYALYWDTLYTVKALIEMQNLLECTLVPETFALVNTPTLNLCYYKNEEEQDPVVSVEKIEWMHELLGTPEKAKTLIKLPTVGNHVLASPIKSNDIAVVESEITRFLEEKLKMKISSSL
jgi:esterase/lipase